MQEAINWLTSGPQMYIAIVFVLYIVIFIPYMIIKNKKAKQNSTKYEEENPDCSKVYVKKSFGGIVSDNMVIYSINDEQPNNIYEMGKQGFFLKPGSHVIELEYSWTRPGVMYKTVTKSTGRNKIEVETEANKKYWVYFDRDNESYEFEEMEEEKSK